MRELLIRMEEVSSEHFSSRIIALQEKQCSLEPLWEQLRLRRPERAEIWLEWLSNGGDLPEIVVPERHKSTMQEPGELPEIGEALEILDQELGFLD